MMYGAAAVSVAVAICMHPCGAGCARIFKLRNRVVDLATKWYRRQLEVAAKLLFALNGFKQCLEVALAKAAASLALDDFVKLRGTVFNRLGEDLQHVAFVVAVDKNSESFEFVERLVDFTHTRLKLG